MEAETMLGMIARFLNVDPKRICQQSRLSKEFVTARVLFLFVMSEDHDWSLMKIAVHLGRTETAMRGLRSRSREIPERMATVDKFREFVARQELERELRSNVIPLRRPCEGSTHRSDLLLAHDAKTEA